MTARLTARSATLARRAPEGWTILEETTIHGRHVRKGTELRVSGIRGRVRFLRHVRKDDGTEWLDVISDLEGGWRSVRPSRVRTVHIKRKLRAA